jgi:SpoVK/Ycf46/Vps4 family AAA+-type ATPase
MSQYDYIKEIAKYGLANDYSRLLETLYALIDYAQKTNKSNFALQLQSIIKEAKRKQEIASRITNGQFQEIFNNGELNDLIIENLSSDYKLENLVCSDEVKKELKYFIKERTSDYLLQKFNIPISNKIIFHGPSGCGKTLAAYVLAGELNRSLTIVNLGAIVSSKLGETSKNLTKIFKKAALEGSIVFFDEFDSLGKIRDYDQDHGEMKRIVNTILQLFDFLSKDCIIIAATNQIQMIDDALLRRFDVSIKLDYPQKEQIHELIDRTLKSGPFVLDNIDLCNEIINKCHDISYYVIKQTLITAIKRTLLDDKQHENSMIINTQIWNELINKELHL